MGCVITHDEYGIFLGTCFGLDFWSNLDCGNQQMVRIFKDEEAARHFVKSWDGQPDPNNFSYPPVESAIPFYATISECEKAGLDVTAWKEQVK